MPTGSGARAVARRYRKLRRSPTSVPVPPATIPASTTRISAAWSRPSAGIAVAAPNPQASPTPDTVRRTPRNASAGEAARRTSPSRHHVRRPAAAVTPLTQPIVTLKGNEFHPSAATTSTSTTWMLSASGRPLSS